MAEDLYIPEEQTGLGPSAKVYRAHDVKGDRVVRLKVLLAEHESRFALDREHLRHRVASLQQICHPLVCRLIELDVQEQDMTLVGEFAEGLDGWHFAARRPVTTAQLRIIAEQLMTALQAGEAPGLPHGDIKPSNLIVDNHPTLGLRLKLQDWGVAQSRHGQPPETLLFRAPELRPEDEPTIQGDLFSAGATLVALLAGKAIGEGDSPGQRQAAWALFKTYQLRSLRPDLDPALHDWLLWLLQTDPSQRPASASQALAVLTGKTESLPMEPVRRRRSWWPALVSLGYNAVALTTLVAYLRWLLHGGRAG